MTTKPQSIIIIQCKISSPVAVKMTFGMECLIISVGSCIPLLLLFVVFIYQLIELYQFRNMPPGPRFTNLPIIGNLMSFDLKAKTFPDAVKR